jgi:formate hydrogenlyase subunit 3/multisubunit Na+/H+ antiporter MnhD subunit
MGESVSILGRQMVLDQTDRLAMGFLFFCAAGLFLLAWRFAAGSLLFPMGLGLLSLLSGALLIRPLIYAALFVEIAAVLSVFAVQAEGHAPTRGGLRYLSFTILALPGLLVPHWLLERFALAPYETSWLGTAAVLLAVSFALLLGVIPFHTWVPALTGEGMPLGGVFVLTVGNGATWFLLLDFLEAYPWLSDHPSFGTVVLVLGLAMAVGGSLLAAAQRRLGPLIGYAALADTGAAFIALGMNTRLGLIQIFLSLLVRPLGLALMAAGVSGLRTHDGNDSFDVLRGVGRKAPWSIAALAFGGLSAAGVPISAGFTWRWALCRDLASDNIGLALAVLLAGVCVMVGVWRGLAALLERPRPPGSPGVATLLASEHWLTVVVVAATIVGCIGVGLFPQFVGPLAVRLAEGYTFFAP